MATESTEEHAKMLNRARWRIKGSVPSEINEIAVRAISAYARPNGACERALRFLQSPQPLGTIAYVTNAAETNQMTRAPSSHFLVAREGRRRIPGALIQAVTDLRSSPGFLKIKHWTGTYPLKSNFSVFSSVDSSRPFYFFDCQAPDDVEIAPIPNRVYLFSSRTCDEPDCNANFSGRMLLRMMVLFGAIVVIVLIANYKFIDEMYFTRQLTAVGYAINGAIFGIFLLGLAKIVLSLLRYMREEVALDRLVSHLESGL